MHRTIIAEAMATPSKMATMGAAAVVTVAMRRVKMRTTATRTTTPRTSRA
jgi:hypothetical protein